MLGGPAFSLKPAQAEAAIPAVKPAEKRIAALEPAPDATAPVSLTDAAASGWGNGFVAAPAFDEEHPEELSYRPFPIAPLLTLSSSVDDPVLARLTAPDVARTIELIDQAGAALPMRLRPGRQVAELMWAQQFKGAIVDAEALGAGAPQNGAPSAPSGLARHSVKTTAR